MDITGKSTVRLIQIHLIFLFCLGTYCVLIWDKKWIGSNFFFLELVDFQFGCLFLFRIIGSTPGSSVPWNFPGTTDIQVNGRVSVLSSCFNLNSSSPSSKPSAPIISPHPPKVSLSKLCRPHLWPNHQGHLVTAFVSLSLIVLAFLLPLLWLRPTLFPSSVTASSSNLVLLQQGTAKDSP